MILQLLQTALEEKGYRVLTADCGEAALETFAACAVDAVALDYEMPGMNGGEVARAMTRARPDVPKLLFSSATNLPREEREAFQGYCEKPCNLLNLVSQIERMTSLPLGACG